MLAGFKAERPNRTNPVAIKPKDAPRNPRNWRVKSRVSPRARDRALKMAGLRFRMGIQGLTDEFYGLIPKK
jgi:hypothetical protein